MRRGAPPPGLRLDPTVGPAIARLEAGPRGLRLGAAEPPAGVTTAPGRPLRLTAGAPTAAHQAAAAAAGGLALLAAPGVARTVRMPRLETAFDRRPPGLDRVVGAALANAGLLSSESGWRAVVLPSMGDLVGDLGPGPVALRADGRRVAAARDGSVEELDLPDGQVAARHEGAAAALAYDGDGRLVAAAGAGVGPLGSAAIDGSPVVELTGAAGAARALALHADGDLSLWATDGGGRLAAWVSPLADPASISLTPDGALAALAGTLDGTPAVAALRADDGALVHLVVGARAIALAPEGDGLLVGGEWGIALLTPPREDT